MSKDTHSLPVGHVLAPALAIGVLAVLLVAGLSALKAVDRVNLTIAQFMKHGEQTVFSKQLPEWVIWLATVVFAFGISFAILSVPGMWRRLVLWLTTIFLVAGWAPVLVLAARSPDIAMPLIAVIWSGMCALIYTNNHDMVCDHIDDLLEKPVGKKADEAR